MRAISQWNCKTDTFSRWNVDKEDRAERSMSACLRVEGKGWGFYFETWSRENFSSKNVQIELFKITNYKDTA